MKIIKNMDFIWEKVGIIIFSGIYLFVFNTTVPHGDALRIARQIEADELIWNPNHLLFDLFGYAWHHFLQFLNTGISILNGFEIISAIATIISLLIFHKILLIAGVTRRSIRLLALLGLFGSKNFLSMAISQYFFMMQMPFLLTAILYGIYFYKNRISGIESATPLYIMGLMLAIATGIEINNVVLVIFIGLLLTVLPRQPGYRNLGSVTRFWGAAAALGFPIFLIGYVFSGSDSNFLSWVLAYQGESDSSLDQFYGIEWSLRGIISAFATTVFNLFFGNIIETAGLGTVIKVMVLQLPLEFNPEYGKIVLAGLLMPVVGLGVLLILIWAIRYARTHFMIAFFLLWILAYVVFNFFWTFGVDLFWVQILPAIWLLLVLNLGAGIGSADLSPALPDNTGRHRWKLPLLTFTVFSLLILNTMQTVMPVATDRLEQYRSKHEQLLNPGDLEIVPGWDNYKWMMQTGSNHQISKLLLMNMALKSPQHEMHIKHLPQYVTRHLESGHRVIVGRLYERDRESNPWYGLADLGWPRSKIQNLLSAFCQTRLGVIDDVVFYKLDHCRGGTD